MKSRAAALGLMMMLGWHAPAAHAQVISRPPDLRLEDVVDSLTGPGGRIIMGDVEYRIGRDPGAKGGVGVIRERWDAGYSITDLAFGEGQWHLVATKNAGIGMQRWARSETFPEQEIRQAWNDGMHVQAIDYGGGMWYVIFPQRQ